MARCSAALRVTIVNDPPASALLALADRPGRLSPSPRNPERFHEVMLLRQASALRTVDAVSACVAAIPVQPDTETRH